MASIFDAPTGEPATLVAGDLWSWVPGALADDIDPATASLAYFLAPEGGGAPVRIDAAPDGARGFLVTLAPAASLAVPPGRYRWTAMATETATGDRVRVGCGVLDVSPDPATSDADPRTPNARILAAIEAKIAGRITKDAESYSIEGRSIAHTPIETLVKMRSVYASLVRAETGGGFMTTRLVRFV